MQNEAFILEIPYGMRDFLPDEAATKRAIESGLADLFAQWGYDEVVTPTIEYLDTLTIGSGSGLEPHMFKFFDRNNRTLALRHEMTTPIARVVASRLRDAELPIKLSYISSVFRYEQAQTGRQCEFNQAGVELVGSASVAADAEVIALAVEGMQHSGLKNFQICLGQVEFINGIMHQLHLTEEQQEKIRKAMEQRNFVDLDHIIDAIDLPQSARSSLKKIPLLRGGEEMLKQAYAMAMNEQSRRALDNLSEIYRLLKTYDAADYVCFDFGVIRDFNYYTGMVFEAYTPALGFPICGGGRYDRMLSDFGSFCPATGFAMGIERILLALEREGLPKPHIEKDVYIAYANDARTFEAIQQARSLRRDGKIVELAFSAKSEAEARSYQKAKGYSELLYIK